MYTVTSHFHSNVLRAIAVLKDVSALHLHSAMMRWGMLLMVSGSCCNSTPVLSACVQVWGTLTPLHTAGAPCAATGPCDVTFLLLVLFIWPAGTFEKDPFETRHPGSTLLRASCNTFRIITFTDLLILHHPSRSSPLLQSFPFSLF